MKILKDLNSMCRARGLSYVLVGGHAVIARGYARTTRDVDLAVQEAQRGAWKSIFLERGYTLYHEQAGFMQFEVPSLDDWPVDVLVVDAPTFAKLQEDAEPIRLGGEAAPVASIMHLLCMKLHSMKCGPNDRFAKDLADVLELLRLGGLDPGSATFEALCQKYADTKIHERIVELWGR